MDRGAAESGQGGGMSACPKCGNKTSEVTHNKPQEDGTAQRRRKCSLCGFRYNTVEVPLDMFSRLKNLFDAIRSITLGRG